MAIEPIITVDFEELDESPQESYPESSLRATMQIRCAWADRLTLAQQLKGGVVTVDDVTNFTLAFAYPHDPSTPSNVRLASISSINPEGNPTAGADPDYKAWDYAILTLEFEADNSSFENEEDPTSTYKITDRTGGYSDIIFVPSNSLVAPLDLHYGVTKEVDGNVQLVAVADKDPVRQVHGFTWTRTIQGLASVSSSIAEWNGTVNDRPYTIPATAFSPRIVAPPETLMFDHFETSDMFDPLGQRQQQLVLYFNYKNLGDIGDPNVQPDDKDPLGNEIVIGGWNHVFPPGDDDPVRLWNTGSPTPTIDTLLRPAPTLNFVTTIDTLWK